MSHLTSHPFLWARALLVTAQIALGPWRHAGGIPFLEQRQGRGRGEVESLHQGGRGAKGSQVATAASHRRRDATQIVAGAVGESGFAGRAKGRGSGKGVQCPSLRMTMAAKVK